MKVRNLENNQLYNNRKEASKELGVSIYKLDKMIKEGVKLETIKPEKKIEHSSSEDRENPTV